MGSGSSKQKTRVPKGRKRSSLSKGSTQSSISSREVTGMPLFRRQSQEAKKKLQHMLYLAQENPDSTFDISGCEISEFPTGIFPLIKVLQKESLLVHNNWMTSLKGGGHLKDLCYLKVLDLHNNEISHLPDEIAHLTSLQALYLQNNKLKSLPAAMKSMKSLQILNMRGNKLKHIPDVLIALPRLHTVDVSQNEITELPNELCNLKTLETLTLDPDSMIRPPSDLCRKGTASIMIFLCQESGVDYVPPSHYIAEALANDDNPDSAKRKLEADMDALDDKVMQYENLKAKKLEEKKILEQQLIEEEKLQCELAKMSANKQKDVLNSLSKDQEKVQEELNALHKLKAEQHQRHLLSLKEAEENAMKLVSSLIEVNEKANKTEELLELLEQERIEAEQWYVVHQEEMDNIRKQEVLDAMEEILSENNEMSKMLDEFRQKKAAIISEAHDEACEADNRLTSVLSMKQGDQQMLFEELQKMEDLQKEAFEVLQVQKDARHQRIAGQIGLIEQELAQLTALEVEHRQLNEVQNKDLLESKRRELTQLLITLMQQRDDRKEELKKRMDEMEKQREDDQMDYWIVQYQRLMDRKPQSLVCQEKMLEFAVVEILEKANATDYTSNFARHRITIETLISLDEEDLKQVGIHELGIRRAISIEKEKYKLKMEEEKAAVKLKEIEGNVEQERYLVRGPAAPEVRRASTPTAPALDVVARGINSECVVCMERCSDMLFLNCGHVCCCSACAKPLSECPLCRGIIEQRILLSSENSAPPVL